MNIYEQIFYGVVLSRFIWFSLCFRQIWINFWLILNIASTNLGGMPSAEEIENGEEAVPKILAFLLEKVKIIF